MKSWFSQFFYYKTKSISQNLKQGPNVLKNQNTTKSKAWLKVSSEMILRMSLYKIKNRLGDDSRYLTISHKKRFVPNVTVLDFVRYPNTIKYWAKIKDGAVPYFATMWKVWALVSTGLEWYSPGKTEPHLCILFSLFDRFRLWSQQRFNDNEVEKAHKNHTLFPSSVSLGSSAIVKVPEQVGAAKIPLRKVPRFPVPKQGSQAGFAKVPRKKFPGERFPARGS